MAEMHLQQKSKDTLVKLGDYNTKYFCSMIKHQRLKQDTTQLKDATGNWQTDPDIIASIFVDYYKELLGRKSNHKIKAFTSILRNGPVLDTTHQLKLLEPYTEKEVKHAIFLIDQKKRKDITEAILEFFRNGKLLKQINSTNIALIPKTTVPENASQYRPIACCNVLYKGISKMIYNRLKEAISVIVADKQSTFVRGRSMVHNVLICHDLLRHYGRKTTPRCLIKIDLRKAYEMLSHLIFTDDLMIFCKANSSSVKRVMEALANFSDVYGLVANMEKSSIFMAGIDDQTRDQLLDITQFTQGTFPIKYLGLPLSSKKWNKMECQQLVDKITSRITTVYSKKLSCAGRLQIIVAVLFSIHNFWGSAFILPQSIL
nr:uncharacterized protein LOC108944873 [Nicotiana tomentosiformis]